MLKKVLICPWFGEMPEWMDSYWKHARGKGFDWIVEDSVGDFKERVSYKLGIDAPVHNGGDKAHDYRAALGFLYEDEIADYDFWGHTDFDCVYGRLDHFYSDDYLGALDTHSDHRSYMAGPFSLYRNTPEINRLFTATDEWQTVLAQPETTGWVETGFTHIIKDAGLRSAFNTFHGHLDPSVIRWDEDRLMEKGREISFFHFRYTKRWPL